MQEFLGDWVNLLGHQRAAYQILTELFTPQTIMQDETRRKIIAWYNRFELFAGIMSGGGTKLSREWSAAAVDFYERQSLDRPNSLQAKIEYFFAYGRLLAIDVTILLSKRTQNAISNEQFVQEVSTLKSKYDEYGQLIETSFIGPSCFVTSFPKAPPPSDDDIVDFRDAHFLYAGDLAPINFLRMDYWGMELMFKYQVSMALQRPPPPELTEIALKKCKMFEAIQYGDQGTPWGVLGCQASLAMASLFLPKDHRHIMWCRRKFSLIERHG